MIRKMLLTGASGMVGRNIQKNYSSKNWDLIVPSSRELDLRDGALVEDYIGSHMPDIIVHAAGKVGGIGANMARPVDFLDRNIVIGRNVIMGARSLGVKNLINLASTCIYPRDASNPLTENMILDGALEPTNEGYAIAKIFALRLCQYIRREDPKFQYKTLIPCNLYGPFDKFDPLNSHLIPAIIHKIHKAKVSGDKTVEIWGNGAARREFMYAEDLVDAIYFAASDLENIPELLNIGVGQDHTINEYYESVARVIGWQGSFVHDLTKPTGMVRKLSDISRQTKLGWQPKIALEEGIAKTYQYYLETKIS